MKLPRDSEYRLAFILKVAASLDVGGGAALKGVILADWGGVGGVTGIFPWPGTGLENPDAAPPWANTDCIGIVIDGVCEGHENVLAGAGIVDMDGAGP